MQLLETKTFAGAWPPFSVMGMGGSMIGALSSSAPNAVSLLKTGTNNGWANNAIDSQQIVVGQNATKIKAYYGNYHLAGSAFVGLCLIGTAYLKGAFPEQEFGSARQVISIHSPFDQRSSFLVSPVSKLIEEAKSFSGLTLEMIAPLLGISRRSIQYRKNEKKISQKNELLLRDLVEALKQISFGNPDQTREILLARITGMPRIYDLLAEGRYDKAVARAKGPNKVSSILSDPTLKFNTRPIADQLAFADDGPVKPMGRLNRSVSRRIVR